MPLICSGGGVGCGVLIGAWEVAARGSQGFVMPSPAATLIALGDILSQPDFWRDDFRISFERFVCGIALGGGAGICLGLAAGFYKQLRLALTPARWMLSSVPSVIMIMLGMLWFSIDSEIVIFVVFVPAPAARVAAAFRGAPLEELEPAAPVYCVQPAPGSRMAGDRQPILHGSGQLFPDSRHFRTRSDPNALQTFRVERVHAARDRPVQPVGSPA